MTAPGIVFAIPGDIDTLTGGYIYEKAVLEGLRAEGRAVDHLALGGGFPDPSPAEMSEAVEALVAADAPLLLDGFLVGATDPAGLARVRVPMVGIVHHPLALETGLSPERARHLFETERANLGRMAHVIVPSAHTREVLVTRYDMPGRKITVCAPGVRRPSRPPMPDAAPPLVLSVGTLHPRKGHDTLIEALARVTDLDWRAAIAGPALSPDFADDLAVRIAQPDLADRVSLAGALSFDALDTLWRRASVFALATRYEGYGMVFAEALAAGLPIVAGNGGAVPEVVPEGAGRLVTPGDVAGFAAALREMLGEGPARAAAAEEARRAGARLPDWPDTAAAIGRAVDRVTR
ncbi:glycosyltransferase family 4 protein [Roseivivax marinus]|uniref:glycosyltransferase family 4 protein n=1 Tax=Roseivivax marinus TaxID=1379903 RepID=UPI001F048527|nr:glycosyltransferase family 4 protein [Roseivivax marinus]UMA66015.1 glycosyltransferase family 4 protein [Roseivivax marinus]